MSDPAHGDRTDVLVDADPVTAVGGLARDLARWLGPSVDGQRLPALHVDGYPLDPDIPLGASPLRDGAIVSVAHPTGCPPPPAQGIAELRLAGGPDAGGVHRLGPGTAVVGSGPEAWIRLDDPALPHSAVEVTVAADGDVTVRPLFGTSATLDGRPLTESRPWRRRSVVAVGHTLLELHTPGFPDTALTPSEDGAGLDFNRPPRITQGQQSPRTDAVITG
ncbi:FtsK/SpoIIIE domain-containing protein, partial [Streptomyces sp. URMC 126]